MTRELSVLRSLTFHIMDSETCQIAYRIVFYYFDTNTSSHHHFYDEINNELTDIENNKIELKKFPTPPKGKTIKDVNVIINIDNDNQKH